MNFSTLALSAALFAPVATATTLFGCPFASTTHDMVGLSLDVATDFANCNDLEAIETDIGDFFEGALADLSGVTDQLGVFELEVQELCQGVRRKLKQHGSTRIGGRSSRNLQNWHYNGDGTCSFCPPDDDDDSRRLEASSDTDLQSLLSDSLTELATMTFSLDQASCLYGQDIEVTVSLHEATAGCNH